MEITGWSCYNIKGKSILFISCILLLSPLYLAASLMCQLPYFPVDRCVAGH